MLQYANGAEEERIGVDFVKYIRITVAFLMEHVSVVEIKKQYEKSI